MFTAAAAATELPAANSAYAVVVLQHDSASTQNAHQSTHSTPGAPFFHSAGPCWCCAVLPCFSKGAAVSIRSPTSFSINGLVSFLQIRPPTVQQAAAINTDVPAARLVSASWPALGSSSGPGRCRYGAHCPSPPPSPSASTLE